jgi:carbamoyltransferase
VLFQAPFEDTAILTVDGYGERASTHIAHGAGLDIETLQTVDFPHSLGSVYAAFTQYLGFRANNGEGKVMGLASYGSTTYDDVIGELIRPTETGFSVDLDFFAYHSPHGPRYSDRLVELLGPPRTAESPVEQRHKDIAHGLQRATEETLLHLARLTREKSGSPRLGMAGGVVLNCVANGRIAREAGFDACFFQPAADDAGTSLGAALWVTHCLKRHPRAEGVTATDYLGPTYSPEHIEAALQRAGVDYERCDDAPAEAAAMLAEGRIIGWFQGAAEFGPRALGNRSILANPALPGVKDTLNARVKFREPFRPFAPSCLEESCGELFDSDVPSPYMLRVYNTLEGRSDDLSGVTHVDGGARVQTVSADQNPRYHALIQAFGERTGIPCVLNTSFNIRGEPIVHTVADALKCTLTTDMDAVFIGDFKVVKSTRSP